MTQRQASQPDGQSDYFNHVGHAKPKPSAFSQKLKRLFAPKIRRTQLTNMLRQLAGMTKASLPLVQALDILCAGTNHPTFKKLLERISQSVNSGQGFAATLSAESLYFDRLTCALIDIGEQNGILTEMLERIADEHEKQDKLRRQLKAVLVYPLSVITIAIGITALLLIKVVPQFETMFQGFGAQLPPLTRHVMTLSTFAQNYWLPVLVSLIALILLVRTAYRRHHGFRLRADRLLLAMPLSGTLLQKGLVASFSQTLATAMHASAPITTTLQMISKTISNQIYAEAIKQTAAEISTGESLTEALRNRAVFPGLLIQMVQVGEESGQIASMLEKVCEYYENEVETSITTLSRLLEPAIMCFLGLLVGGLILAMYLPVFDLGNVLSGGY